MERDVFCALHVTSLFNFLTQDSVVLLMVGLCKHCGLSGKFSTGVTEISTAQSHYWLHLSYLFFCGFKMPSVAHSQVSLLSSQKISPL